MESQSLRVVVDDIDTLQLETDKALTSACKAFDGIDTVTGLVGNISLFAAGRWSAWTTWVATTFSCS